MEIVILSEGHITKDQGPGGGVWTSACGRGSLSPSSAGPRVGREGW